MTEEIAKYEVNKNRSVNSRILRLKCSDGSMITGSVNLNRFPDSYDRVSDIVTKNTEQFIVMYNVTMTYKEVEKPLKHKSLLVNRDYIIWAAPDIDQK